MKAYLLFRDRDYDPQQPPPPQAEALEQDLELITVMATMAAGDRFLFETIERVMLLGLESVEDVRYRQDILRDCLAHPDVVRELYNLTLESIENKKKLWLGIFRGYPSAIVNGAVRMLQMFVGLLQRLRDIADAQGETFESEGFRRFFAMVQDELDDAFFISVRRHLKTLKFRDGVLFSAELGQGNEDVRHVLLRPDEVRWRWLRRLTARWRKSESSFTISERDHAGARILGDLKDIVLNQVANAVAQSADHIDSFLTVMRTELAFYVGCINLYERLAGLGEPIAFPDPVAVGERRHTFRGLYDIALALTVERRVVGKDADLDGSDLVIITGANQGGKSTFLRSIGLAQVMMACGMFVAADSFSADLCVGIYTHFKREEDTTMESGKLDEELRRMSAVADHLVPNALVLFNESFAATNEREGSEIARQITTALIERGVKVFFVTHLYAFAHGFVSRANGNTAFLRADRKPGGQRTFRIVPGEPLKTSFGEDLYKEIFPAEEPVAAD